MAEKSAPPPPPPKKGGAPLLLHQKGRRTTSSAKEASTLHRPSTKRKAPPPQRRARHTPSKSVRDQRPGKKPVPKGCKNLRQNADRLRRAHRKHLLQRDRKVNQNLAQPRRRKAAVCELNWGSENPKFQTMETDIRQSVGHRAGTVLDDLEDTRPKEPDYHPPMFDVRFNLTNPKPKRDRYKVQCAYPECGHADKIGAESKSSSTASRSEHQYQQEQS